MHEETSPAITIIGAVNEIEDLSKRLSEGSVATTRADAPSAKGSLPFSIEPLSALIPIGAGGMIAALAKCIVAYLRERKKRITIHTSNNQIKVTADNYTEQDLLQILDKLHGKVTVVVSEDPATKRSA